MAFCFYYSRLFLVEHTYELDQNLYNSFLGFSVFQAFLKNLLGEKKFHYNFHDKVQLTPLPYPLPPLKKKKKVKLSPKHPKIAI